LWCELAQDPVKQTDDYDQDQPTDERGNHLFISPRLGVFRNPPAGFFAMLCRSSGAIELAIEEASFE
jgi:hypothetical protein